MAEECGFQQCFRNGHAVDGYETMVGSFAVRVNFLRNKLFARAGFALNENREFGRRKLHNALGDFVHWIVRASSSYNNGFSCVERRAFSFWFSLRVSMSAWVEASRRVACVAIKRSSVTILFLI